jgi:hypothetical protein
MTNRDLLTATKNQRAVVAEYLHAKQAQVKTLEFKYKVLTDQIEKLKVKINETKPEDEVDE